ncbi:MAG TPA: metal/formaldehyde-sensitive transcriptional repressor [Solimonas sp.]
MGHTVDDKRPLLNRVRRIQGQLSSLEKALEAEVGCAAVLQQIAAVRGAVNGLMAQVLEGHLRQHLVPTAADVDDELESVIRVLRSYMK